ncbi:MULTISPECIES: hypothetical protein [Nocardia]|uniref:Phage tail protein n=1 Tax=Nocardia sputorum TaxID=2984338 RepID=A0ABN6UD15_9NOCA|nr:hypothetical protein [Nocardia sputorum]BDT93476.1 hypothetical protein IFM12275_34520 [Nocardia sputorum]BDU03189.1 hypothetical protein IFM12276_62170 [Nocardia sputorum]
MGWEAGVSGTEWEMFCSEVFAIAERYAIQIFSNPGTLVLSSGSSSTEAEARGANPHIELVDMGDAAVRIETGWCVRAVADYEIQFEDKPSQAAAAVEAIILGGAEEYVIVDDDDRWVAFGWCIRGKDSLMSQPPHITSGRKAVRRLLPWRSA